MKIQITQEIPAQRIADMMTGAFECNDMTTAWCWGARLAGALEGKEADFKTEERYPWYCNPSLYERADLEIKVFEIEDEGEALVFGEDGTSNVPTGNVKVHTITQASIEKGLCLMASKYPHHFGDMIQENDDAETADVFLQMISLGEVVYG